MDDLIAFLVARLDEDEAGNREMHEARVCSGCRDGWEAGFDPDWCDCGYPDRVLREVAAIRAHIRMWEAFAVNFTHVDETEFEFAKREALEDVLAADAAIWSDHPDYPGRRQEAVTGG